MEQRGEIKAQDILEAVSEMISSPQGVADDNPAVLSCGGIYLRGRKIPKSLSSFKLPVFLPNAGVRVYRIRAQSTRQSFKKILEGESLN